MKAMMLILACLLPLEAQSLSYGTVARPGATIDFRNAATVMPDRHLAGDPPTCVLGERYFNTATAKTRRCTAADTWSDDGGGGYTLPAATASALGGVKVGPGLAIDGTGVLSAGSGGGPACDPFTLSLYCMVEDFVTGGTTSGSVGAAGMRFDAISSGTVSYHGVNSLADYNHPGVAKITTTATTGSGGVLKLVSTGSINPFNMYTWLNTEWEVRWIFKLDSTVDARIRLGLSGSTSVLVPNTGEPNFIFRYDTDAAFADNTKNTVGSWVAQFCGYNSTNCADTAGVYKVLNVQPDTNWHMFSIRQVGTTITWKLDNTDVATMCAAACDMVTPTVTNPAGSNTAAPAVLYGISGVTARILYLDYVSARITGNFSRY